MQLREESFTRTCSICGDHMGTSGPDHTECAKLKQLMFKDRIKKYKAKKKLTERELDEFALYIRKFEYA